MKVIGAGIENKTMKNNAPLGIHWFRRDLRLSGNTALLQNWKQNQGRVLGLFCFDSRFLSRPDFSHTRFAFFLKTLKALREELRSHGGDLLVLDQLPQEALPEMVQKIRVSGHQISMLSYNRDYEPFARARDQEIERLMKDVDVPVKSFRDHLLIEPHELTKGREGEYYQVYSPFAKKWFDLLATPEIQERIAAQKKSLQFLFSDRTAGSDLFTTTWEDILGKDVATWDKLESFKSETEKHVTIDIPPAGYLAVQEALNTFKEKMNDYKLDRDIPEKEGTSRFSHFLKNGSLTTSQLVAFFGLDHLQYTVENGAGRFLKELVWREFYYHILYHRPDVESETFNKKYRNVKWPNNKKWFELWCQGQTGFPIVDAGMRQLNTTGWMHNRVRMIVGSFLVKDLLIDWRWGEKYFMEKLLDGDLAPNNGSWQWVASTGCDPQPYFRVFNPWLQSKKFDPDGEYIRRYIPELRNVSTKALHLEEGERGQEGYPEPMVRHSVQKVQAIKLLSLS